MILAIAIVQITKIKAKAINNFEILKIQKNS
jgi:hypothetical protein